MTLEKSEGSERKWWRVTEGLLEDMSPQLQFERAAGIPQAQVRVMMMSRREWSVLKPRSGLSVACS